MPDNNEVQGVLCGTCGQPRSSSAHASYGAAIDHRFIAAPVVPSDERLCDSRYRGQACHLPLLHGGDHMNFDIGGFEWANNTIGATAPPTTSQDAEGDGRWRVVARVVGAWRSYERTNADGRVESHRLDESLALDIESAIRAPYEELVKAAREIVTLGCLCTTEHHRDGCPVVRMKAALESLGGRS